MTQTATCHIRIRSCLRRLVRKMPHQCVVLALWAGHLASPAFGQAMPFADGERLVYEISWPSGLSLGETEFWARATKTGWKFEAIVHADLPTMEIRDEYRSVSDAALCSQEFEKEVRHGNRKTKESVIYDQENRVAHRKTLGGGGESEIRIAPCTRDGLTFLYALRQNLALGRIPPPDDINFGAQYQVSVTYAESRELDIGGGHEMSDRIIIDLTGSASSHSFEVFFSQDAARTPLLMRVPFELGTFSLKLLK